MAAASEQGRVVTNGMSCFARDGQNANAALLVGVSPEDFGSEHPLAGIEFQRKLEEAAFRVGGGGYRAPVQRVEDFLQNRASTHLGDVHPTYRPGVTPSNLGDCLPEVITEAMRQGIQLMDRRLHGFAYPDAAAHRNPRREVLLRCGFCGTKAVSLCLCGDFIPAGKERAMPGALSPRRWMASAVLKW